MKAHRTHGVANDHEFHLSIQASQPMQAVATHTGWRQPPRLRVVYPADIADTLSAVEDLWLRTAQHPSLRVAVVRDTLAGDNLLLVRSPSEVLDEEGSHLLDAVKNGARYQWRQNGTTGSLVSDIRRIDSTVVVELTPLKQLRCWPDGDAVERALQSLLNRLNAQEM